MYNNDNDNNSQNQGQNQGQGQGRRASETTGFDQRHTQQGYDGGSDSYDTASRGRARGASDDIGVGSGGGPASDFSQGGTTTERHESAYKGATDSPSKPYPAGARDSKSGSGNNFGDDDQYGRSSGGGTTTGTGARTGGGFDDNSQSKGTSDKDPFASSGDANAGNTTGTGAGSYGSGGYGGGGTRGTGSTGTGGSAGYGIGQTAGTTGSEGAGYSSGGQYGGNQGAGGYDSTKASTGHGTSGITTGTGAHGGGYTGSQGADQDLYAGQGQGHGKHGQDQYGAGDNVTGTGKPKLGDKIRGGAEVVTGKLTGNEGLVEKGQDRKTGF
ncbi:hypothetical protein BDN72DRAFT_958215 [Pluteus cervinus]|uniref:Uncharacterized protein n=1 Tax=Pluteus cervinus TaxID=181527 RepID=A0ACD3B120_9AGAR|nr:hypothetical protein BDN72DRAFT_958215 [Pluteus cervinus]